jgi:O-antigen/teichoic acid export membrane protein
MSFKKAFFKNISSFASFSYISQGLEFFSTVILSRLLLPEEYGFVAIIVVFTGFMHLFASVGIGASIVRSDYRGTFHQHLHSLSIWIGLVLALSMVLLAYPIAYFFEDNKLIVPTMLVSFRFIFESLGYVPSAILSKKLKFRELGIVNLIQSGFIIILSIILAFLGFSYWSLIIPLIFAPLLTYAYLISKVDLQLRIYGWRATKMVFIKIRSLMGYMSVSTLFTYWAANVDKVIIGRLYTQAELGLYNRAFRFIGLATKLITGIFSRVLFPSLKKLMQEKGNVRKESLDILRIVTLFNMPILLILLIFPNELVILLWGKEWAGVSYFLPYIAVILIFVSMLRTITPVYLLYNRERTLTAINIFESVSRVVVIIIGGFFSINHIIIFITLNILFISIPIHGYYGFYKSFGYNKAEVLKFWLPYTLTGIGIFLSIYFQDMILRVVMLLVFNALLLINLRTTIRETLKTLKTYLKS